MKNIIVILLFFPIAVFAQYDTIMERSYMTMLDKRYDELMPIEGIWKLEKTRMITKGKNTISTEKTHTRVAIYKAGNIFVITYLSREFHATEQLTMLHDDEFLFERPADVLRASAILQGIQLRVDLMSDSGNREIAKENLIFTKVYPVSGTTRQNE